MFNFLTSTFDPQNFLDWINSGGIIGLLAFILIGGARKWWVFGWQYRDIQERMEKLEHSNETWMNLAMRGVNVTERIVGTTPSEGVANDLSDW